MLNKEKRFYEILKKYGVKEFWCTPTLNLSDACPDCEINVNCKKEYVSKLDVELYKLFNEDVEEDSMLDIYVNDFSILTKKHLNTILEGTELRRVNG